MIYLWKLVLLTAEFTIKFTCKFIVGTYRNHSEKERKNAAKNGF